MTTGEGGEVRGTRFHVKPCLARGEGRATTEGRARRVGASWCGLKDCAGPRNCAGCRAAYMRDWRKSGREKLTDPAKGRARAVVKMRLRRGTLNRKPCEACGAKRAEAHHDDYGKASVVRWLCRACHKAEHQKTNTGRMR